MNTKGENHLDIKNLIGGATDYDKKAASEKKKLKDSVNV